jgi:hypothetical protein
MNKLITRCGRYGKYDKEMGANESGSNDFQGEEPQATSWSASILGVQMKTL